MVERTVHVGVMTYAREGGLTMFALSGAVVNVDDKDIERFDRLNGGAPKESPAKPVRASKANK